MKTMDEQCLDAADEIIELMGKEGHDYSPHRQQIADELYRDGVWNGNWDSITEFGDDLPDLRLIQEDEYDQSMDEDEKPDFDSQIAQVSGGYLFYA